MRKNNVYGVGVSGHGEYSPGKDKIAYNVWCNILDRCCSEKTKIRHKSYIKCTVCEEWLNFQNFADFFYANKQEADWQLDKDILHKGNIIYSPQTCVFVPPDINKLFVRRELHRGHLPIGVHYEASRKRYKASLHDGTGKTKFLGRFHTAEEAFEAYKQEKELIIKQKAVKYQAIITERLFDALMNYQVEITD